MTTLRKALYLLALLAATGLPLAAQLTDCAFTRTFTTDANLTSSSNLSGQTPCVNWRITYSVTGTLTSTVTFQTSPDNTNWTSVPNTLCSSVVQPPCILQGTNPLTGTTQGMSLFASYGAYVRVITSASGGAGTGTIRGYGSKGATASAASGGSGNGSVTSVAILGTANQITATGTCTITTTGTCTLSLPASISGVTNLTPGADFTITQKSVVPFTSVSAGALVNTLVLKTGQVSIGTASPAATATLYLKAAAPQLVIEGGRPGSSTAISRLSVFNTLGGVSPYYTATDLRTFNEGPAGGNFQFFTNADGGATAEGNLTEKMRLSATGNLTIGIPTTYNLYGLDVSRGVGLTGTARFFDQTATTGATLVTITPGAAQTAASKVLEIAGNQKFGGTNSTAAVAGLIGTTCPAVTCTAAYTWVQAIAADNSVVYFPVWK